jgi:Flp pilus assembly protein protease CpaA
MRGMPEGGLNHLKSGLKILASRDGTPEMLMVNSSSSRYVIAIKLGILAAL